MTKWSYDGFLLDYEPIEDSIKVRTMPDGSFEVRYIVLDGDPEDPFGRGGWDGIGRFVHWRGYGAEQLAEYKTAGTDQDAVAIDKYEHGGIAYSVAGEGTRCRWDTSNIWAYWVPDKETLASWAEYAAALKPDAVITARAQWMVKAARSACALFNDYVNGNVYGVVCEYFNADRSAADIPADNCWGYYGINDAERNIM